jgi:two-component system, cell cycle response regulator DivK
MARVLMVEDNPASQKLFGGLLNREGHELAVVDNARDGIARALAEPFDLIIMDMSLPGMDGETATRTLRADPIGRDIPILAVTANAMAGDKERILAAGCNDYLSKPIAYREFLAKVGLLLEVSQS